MPKSDNHGVSTPAEVVAAAREGDESAWETLFDLHYARLYRFFRARLSSAEQAEDLASNVFLEAFRSIQNFKWQGKPFEAWLFGIARHQLASFYRSRHIDVTDADLETEPAVRDEFIAIEIRELLEALPREYQTALELRFIVGLSGVEAAEVMGKSHGGYRSLLFRAVKAFREESLRGDDSVPARAPLRSADAAGFTTRLGDAKWK
jgi:RNA polymerase sigma-70 factor (ECF subfamily)